MHPPTAVYFVGFTCHPQFRANRDLRIAWASSSRREDSEMPRTASEYRNKAILLDVTYADPQAGIHMRAGSADRDGSAASISEARKRSHYARPGHASAATTLVPDRCRSTSAATKSPPSRWKALGASERKVAIRLITGSGKYCRRDGRIFPGTERRQQITPLLDHLGDYPGRDFATSSSV